MVSNNQVDEAIAKKYGTLSSYTQMTTPNGDGQSRSTCPKCSAYRKKRTQKCLSINHNTTEYFCHNPDCGIKGMIVNKDCDDWVNSLNVSVIAHIVIFSVSLQ